MPRNDTHEEIDTLKKDEATVTMDMDHHSRAKRNNSRKLFALTTKEARSDANRRPSSSTQTSHFNMDGVEEFRTTKKFLHDTSSQPDLKLPPSSIVEVNKEMVYNYLYAVLRVNDHEKVLPNVAGPRVW